MQNNNFLQNLGNTPLTKINFNANLKINLFSKLEFMNPTGSVKDRSASYVISELLKRKMIDKDTTLIESSSGNFGISLAAYARFYGLKFKCIVDPKILPANEKIIRMLGAEILKVNEADAFGGYLLTRIKTVNRLLLEIENSYWVNQYANPLIMESFKLLGDEIYKELPDVNYIFIGVSSCGTISGISNTLKPKNKNIKIIAVDVEGSVIFKKTPGVRSIPGIGSSMVPAHLDNTVIDEVVHVTEEETVKACYEILENDHIMAGGSSGSVYAAIKKYFADYTGDELLNVVTLFPDKGERYLTTIYEPEWVKENIFSKY